MSKAYLALIALLVIIALAVGGFAFYRSSTRQTTPVAPTPTYTPPSQPATNNQQPATNSSEIIDTSKNTIPLTVTSPKPNSQVSTANITISGTTAPGADVGVQDKDLIADSTGRFSTTITLEEGDNDILIAASNATGQAEWETTVTYSPSQ